MKDAEHLQLFLDESGRFQETSTLAEERELSRDQRFSSMLGGLLVQRGALTAQLATQVLKLAHRAAGITYAGESHGRKLTADRVDAMTRTAVPELTARHWQPVRLVNRERAVFGDRETTYTNMVAELALRCLEARRLEHRRPVVLELVCPGVWDSRTERTFEEAAYRSRVTEVLARAAIRSGIGDLQRNWQVDVRFRPMAKTPELQLSDLVCNASHHDFKKLQPDTAEALRKAMGRYDMSLAISLDLERIDRLVADSSLGMALIHVAECMFAGNLDAKVRTHMQHRLRGIVERLASAGAPARDPQLQVVGNFLEQTIHWERDLLRGRGHCEWFAREVAEPLTGALPEDERGEVAWFSFLLQQRRLAACNHLGDLTGASESVTRLEQLQPMLVSRWERLDLFLHAQIVTAVHRTDTRDFAAAIDMANRVEAFHADLAELFHAAMPDALPEHVRSERRGEALGTAMQACMLGADEDPTMLDRARELGEAAIEEFANRRDKARQMQYRCQLETIAGRWLDARHWLARALECGDDHAAIAAAIGAMPKDDPGRRFLVLHWLRLGAAVHREAKTSDEAVGFRTAWAAAQADLVTLSDGERDHPRPSILHYLGEIQFASGEDNRGIESLRLLIDVTWPVDRTRPLAATPLAALLSAAVATMQDRGRASLLLDGRGNQPGLVQVLKSLRQALAGHPEWVALLDEWGKAADFAGKSDSPQARQALGRLAARIRH